ncbi:putative DNA-binding domain-containing protein [Bdellovibrio sp. HCB209]|uniref:HvfC/BufC family peptide modification chaperone n=1 Tax=Bdellovibrio sp. HCB209 TaxID=3394354 RepID=UPI0039B55817
MRMNEALLLFKENVLNPEALPSSLSELKPIGGLSPDEAFEIYNDLYFSKLSSTLAKTYEAVAWSLGSDLFQEQCVRYIDAHPLLSFRLSEYGEHFAAQLQTIAKKLNRPYLPDLAILEFLIKEVRHAGSAISIGPEEFQGMLNANNFKVSFIEGMKVHQSMYSVADLWRRRHDSPSAINEVNWSHPQSLLIYKNKGIVEVQEIEATHAEVILSLQQGKTISEALSEFSDVISPADNAKLFQTLIAAEVIDDITLL